MLVKFTFFLQIKPTLPLVNCKKDNLNSNNENVVLVVDTNIFIHELDVIKNVLNSHIKGNVFISITFPTCCDRGENVPNDVIFLIFFM